MSADARHRLPRLDEDPDARMRRWIWLVWAALTLALALGWVAAPARRPSDAFPWLVKAPLLALYLMWPLWQGGRLLLSHVRHAPLEPWQGRYYEFEDVHIRVMVDGEDGLLFVASDVLDALRIEGRGRHLDRIRAVAGRDGVRTLQGKGVAVFTETGLHAWLERNSRRDAARFAAWLRAQVVEPHRRKLERGIPP